MIFFRFILRKILDNLSHIYTPHFEKFFLHQEPLRFFGFQSIENPFNFEIRPELDVCKSEDIESILREIILTYSEAFRSPCSERDFADEIRLFHPLHQQYPEVYKVNAAVRSLLSRAC